MPAEKVISQSAFAKRGQFATPLWLAEAMVHYVTGGPTWIFDPCVGGGAFLEALKHVAPLVCFRGVDRYDDALAPAKALKRPGDQLSCQNFFDMPVQECPAIVANPPYIRHQLIPPHEKVVLRRYAAKLLNTGEMFGLWNVDGHIGYHVFFVLKILEHLGPHGRAAIILPSADTFEGLFAQRLWSWVAARYCIDVVVTFTEAATPFPGLNCNAVLILVQNNPPRDTVMWAQCSEAGHVLHDWVARGARQTVCNGLWSVSRSLGDLLEVGLSRPPFPKASTVTLGDLATVRRGVVTGGDSYFLVTRERARSMDIPDDCLFPLLRSVHDVEGEYITQADLEAMERKGTPSLLFSCDDPRRAARYIAHGRRIGAHKSRQSLQRRVWHKMEQCPVPEFLFVVRTNIRVQRRFIRNVAGVLPSNNFVCVYPREPGKAFADKLWKVLRDPRTVANLRRVGKAYGGGMLKVEGGALLTLPIPEEVLNEAKLCLPKGKAYEKYLASIDS